MRMALRKFELKMVELKMTIRKTKTASQKIETASQESHLNCMNIISAHHFFLSNHTFFLPLGSAL